MPFGFVIIGPEGESVRVEVHAVDLNVGKTCKDNKVVINTFKE